MALNKKPMTAKAVLKPVQTKRAKAATGEGHPQQTFPATGNPAKRRRFNDEERMQMQLVTSLRFARPKILFFHVPNGGVRSKAEAGRLKAMGVLPGVADLCFVFPDRVAFLELKAGDNKQTPAQKLFAAECESRGISYAVAYSVKEAEEIVRRWYPAFSFPWL